MLFCVYNIITAQKKESNHNMPKSTNLLDMHVEVFKDITKDSIVEGIDFSKVQNFNDLTNQAKDLTPKQKVRYKQLYELQKNEPSKKRKDSIGILINNLLIKQNKTP